MKKILIWFNNHEIIAGIIITILFIILVTLVYYRGYREGYYEAAKEIGENFTPPVEKNVIDTLYITKDSIINRIKYIEIIKHDTIEKVYNLDDTASIDLFYKLVTE